MGSGTAERSTIKNGSGLIFNCTRSVKRGSIVNRVDMWFTYNTGSDDPTSRNHYMMTDGSREVGEYFSLEGDKIGQRKLIDRLIIQQSSLTTQISTLTQASHRSHMDYFDDGVSHLSDSYKYRLACESGIESEITAARPGMDEASISEHNGLERNSEITDVLKDVVYEHALLSEVILDLEADFAG